MTPKFLLRRQKLIFGRFLVFLQRESKSRTPDTDFSGNLGEKIILGLVLLKKLHFQGKLIVIAINKLNNLLKMIQH